MALSYAEVAEILKLVDASSLDELTLEIGDARLVVRRHGSGAPTETAMPSQPRPAPSAAAPSAPAPMAPKAKPAPAAAPAEDGAVAVESPMVGRFYRRPSPEEPVFVEEGAHVAAGQTLCLIEVMKLFTAVEAPMAGTILAIGVEDGAAVEYDQPLFWIRPD